MTIENDVGDDAFNAGFASESQVATASPPVETTPVEPSSEVKVNEPVAELAAEPKYAKITEDEYKSLLEKATAIDSIKAENKQRFDKVFGDMGGMKQLLDRLQSSTQAGQQIQVSEADFEEMIEEGYPDFAKMQAAGFNRVLAKLQLRGTDDKQGFDPEKVGEIFNQRFGTERDTIKQQIRDEMREEIARDTITELHDDWEKVLNTPEFGEWAKTNKVYEQKDRRGTTFGESLDAKWVAKFFTDFKESQKKATARANVLAANVSPRGSGGHAPAPSGDDDFDAGFNS